ncbi:MAG TPA: type VI secretion system baseplate subunit TssF [Ferruginibacter sp.]|nr:type VI secretion system baseplate subunit TssF [Ferruginibacter sp.]
MAAIKKERIKDQMVNTAARIWGIDEHEIEQNADPLAMLLIEACAAELEKIGHNIAESHTRLLDNLAEVMLPESLSGAIPASGILQAMPTEDSTIIDSYTDFSITQKIYRTATNTNETVVIHFSPVANYKLYKATLGYIALGNKLYNINENNRKELISAADNATHANEITLALKLENQPENLDGLNIYFDLRSHSAANIFYNALSHATCFINENPIQVITGNDNKDETSQSQREILLSANGKTNKLNRKISHIYQHHFLQVKDRAKISSAVIPVNWHKNFSPETIKKIESENIVFIKLVFKKHFSQEVFDAIACNINAFAAVNKKLNNFNYKTDEWLNIVPIPDKGFYFDLENVKNEKGEQYKIRPMASANNLLAGELIVRSSGVGKTSSQDVREMIGNITETIRGQSAYFGQISNEVVLSKLKEIGKILTSLEDSINTANDKKTQLQYLMLRPHKKGEMIFVDFWTTNEADANNIKSGIQITAANSTQINSKKSFTVTGFSGGKNAVSETEKKVMLRQQLLSGDKIISAEDVKLLCARLYGNKLLKTEVQKGVQVSNKNSEGFIRTIDVILTYSNQVNETMENEMENLYHELEYILQKDASPVMPFRIIINK